MTPTAKTRSDSAPSEPVPNDSRREPAEEWLDQHGDALFSFAMGRIRNRATAEDLVQETLLSALKAESSFAERSSIRTWLIGILKNKILDHFRSNHYAATQGQLKESESVINKHFNKLGIWNEILADWGSHPERYLENKQFIKQLQECLSNLSELHRAVFTLKVIDGIGQEEICKAFDLSPSNLWVITHRARMSLRDCIEVNWIKAGA